RGGRLERAGLLRLLEAGARAGDDAVVRMAEEAIEQAGIVGQRVRRGDLRRGGVGRLRILDRVQLLAGLVPLGVLLAAELLAQVIGQRARRDPLVEEAVEVRLVLRVLGGALDALRLADGSARRA